MTKFQYYQHTFKNTFKIFSRASFEEFISFFYITVLFGLFWAFVYIFTQIFGFEGVSMAYMVNYAIYWFILSKLVFKEFDKVV